MQVLVNDRKACVTVQGASCKVCEGVVAPKPGIRNAARGASALALS